jgi:hypothetical protein
MTEDAAGNVAVTTEPVAGPEWPIRSDLNGTLIGGHPVSLVVLR